MITKLMKVLKLNMKDKKRYTKLPDITSAQVLSYLKATKIQIGLLINFRKKLPKDGIKRLSI